MTTTTFSLSISLTVTIPNLEKWDSCATLECFRMQLVGQKQVAAANLLRVMIDVSFEFISVKSLQELSQYLWKINYTCRSYTDRYPDTSVRSFLHISPLSKRKSSKILKKSRRAARVQPCSVQRSCRLTEESRCKKCSLD